MKLITTEDLLKTVAERWKKQYLSDTGWLTFFNLTNSGDVYNRLIQNAPLTVEKVNEIIGNESWTKQYCFECGEDSYLDHIETNKGSVCANCVTDAYVLLK